MFKNILKAKSKIEKHIIRTECLLSAPISNLINSNVYVKYDNRQITGSIQELR